MDSIVMKDKSKLGRMDNLVGSVQFMYNRKQKKKLENHDKN
jgi:hypothetical protein